MHEPEKTTLDEAAKLLNRHQNWHLYLNHQLDHHLVTYRRRWWDWRKHERGN